LALTLAAPDNRVFLVGDDDQSIYGWRLADVRRVLDLAAELPGLRRIALETNYRCPRPVVERAVRLVEWNRERFGKRIRSRPRADGSLILAPDGSDDAVRARRLFASWPDEGSRAVLARTNRELAPAAAVALELEMPFRATDRVPLLLTDELDPLLAALEADEISRPALPLLVRIGQLRAAAHADPDRADLPGALLAWAAGFDSVASLASAVRARRDALDRLRRDDAALTLATAHATKGLEFDHVGVVGLDEGRFPSARTLADAADPARVLEEERRLAYVAWTRACRSLTLVYDPAAPSPFMLEAFSSAELGT
jgi:superfamily I DNA/RNA helicase